MYALRCSLSCKFFFLPFIVSKVIIKVAKLSSRVLQVLFYNIINPSIFYCCFIIVLVCLDLSLNPFQTTTLFVALHGTTLCRSGEMAQAQGGRGERFAATSNVNAHERMVMGWILGARLVEGVVMSS